MSKHSISYNLNQRKYSLKFIIYLFILFDILLFFQAPTEIFWLAVSWEVMVFFGILIGLRGQRIYKDLFFDLLAIRKNPKYNDKEELRGFRIVRVIDQATIEHDLWMSEQEAKAHKFKKKKIKINNKKNKGGEKSKMNQEAIRELFAWIGGWIIAIGLIIDEVLYLLGLSPIVIIAITIIWVSGDFIYFWYLWHYWGVKKEDVIAAEIPGPVTTTIGPI